MGKFLSILIGVIFTGLGVWGIIAWSYQVLIVLQAAVSLMGVVVGLGILVFGLSELRAGSEEPPAVDTGTPPAPPSAGSEPEQK